MKLRHNSRRAPLSIGDMLAGLTEVCDGHIDRYRDDTVEVTRNGQEVVVVHRDFTRRGWADLLAAAKQAAENHEVQTKINFWGHWRIKFDVVATSKTAA